MRRILNTSLESFQGTTFNSNISLEEEQVMLDEAAADQAEASQDLVEAERIIEVSDALEDLAVVADGIEEATPAEAALVEIAGDMAVAGTDVSPEEIVPAMESYIGRRISTESIKETAAAIWKSIQDFLKKVWEKVENFFYKIFGTIPALRRRLKDLEKRIDAASGSSLGEEKKIKLTSGLSSLSINGKVVKSGAELKAGMTSLTTAVDYVFATGADDVAKMGEKIAEHISDFEPAQHVKAATALADMFDTKTGQTRLPGAHDATDSRWTGFDAKMGDALFGNVSLVVKSPKVDEAAGLLGRLESIRRTGAELVPTSQKSTTTPSDVEFAALSNSEMTDCLDKVTGILDKLEAYQRGKGAKAIKAARAKLDAASKKATAAVEKMRTGEDADEKAAVPYYKSMLNFNVAFARWAQSPSMAMASRSITSIKAVMSVCEKSLSLYK